MSHSLDPRLADSSAYAEQHHEQHALHDTLEPSQEQQHAHQQPILPGDPRSLSSHAPQHHQQPEHSAHLYHEAYDAAQHSYAPPPQTPQMGMASNIGTNNLTPSISHSAAQKRTPASGQNDDSKRPRACEACRGLKVKCEFEPTNPDGPCKRCTKAHRNCTITAPSRKRQKKTDSRVAELEKKIDALTQVLQATRSESQGGEVEAQMDTGDRGQSQPQAHPYDQMASIAYGPQCTGRAEAGNEVPPAPNTYGQAMKTDMATPSQSAWPAPEFQQYSRMPDLSRAESGFAKAPVEGLVNTPTGKTPMVMVGQKRKASTQNKSGAGGQASGALKPGKAVPARSDNLAGRPSSKHSMTNEYADVIDRGLINSDLASALFDRYIHQMAPAMPSVVFPSGTTAVDVRKTKPILFLAILAVGAMTDHPDLAKLFTNEVMQVYGDRIVCRGEKSLELIQALLISALWYWPPEHFEEIKFYQLIHMAAVMSIDIGIHKQNTPSPTPSSAGKSMAGMWNWRKQAFPDASSIEARRTWVSCYFVCCNASTGLRRPNLIYWSPYIAESIEMLESSALASPSDKLVAQWAKSQHIMERIMPHFALDEDHPKITLADPTIQAALADYEQDLNQWRDQVPVEVRGPLLKMSGHVVSLFMHEVALNVDTASKSRRGSQTKIEGQPEAPLPEAQVTALASCMESVDEIFSTFLSLDVDTIRILPVMHFVRVAYAIAILIKVYFAAITPGNPFASIVDKDNMKVEQYLDDLLQKFKEIAADDKSRSGSKFLMVLIMLRNCFYRGQKPKTGRSSALPSAQHTRPGSAQPTEPPATLQQSPQQPQQQQQIGAAYGLGSTPLDLLSQVATGSSAAAARPDTKTDPRQPYMPLASGAWAPWDSADVKQPQAQANGMAYNIDPSLGGAQHLPYDAGIGMEAGFEMPGELEGDLAMYFGDDAYQAFFKAMMEGAGTGGMGFDEFPVML